MADTYDRSSIYLPVPTASYVMISQTAELKRNGTTTVRVFAGRYSRHFSVKVGYKATIQKYRELSAFTTDENGYAYIEVALPDTKATTATLRFTEHDGTSQSITYIVTCTIVD